MARKKISSREYLEFLREHLGINLVALPKRVPRKQERSAGWIIPPFRFSNHPLIPEISFYPCDLCKFARYNTLCILQNKCAAYAFWSVQKVSTLDATTPTETRTVALQHFGIKSRRRKRVRKGRRVLHLRNYKKPAFKKAQPGQRR